MSYRKIHDLPSGFELNKEAGFWSVAVPEQTFNLLKNPGFEGATPLVPFTASGGSTFATDTTWRAFGKNSVLLTLLSAGVVTFTQSNSESILTPLKDYTFSFYYKGTAGKTVLVELVHSLGSTVIASKTLVATGKVERPSLTFNVPAGMLAAHNLLVKITNQSGATYAFNVDAFQLEPKGYLTTYIDGDVNGGSWQGVPYASFSVRGDTSPGGRIYDFKKDFGFSIMAYQGTGMPPMEHRTTDQIYLGGKVVQRTLAEERKIVLVGALESRTYDQLLVKIDAMNQTLAPATGSQTQLPLQLKFTPYAKSTQLGQELGTTVLYTGGMEGDTSNLSQARYALTFEEFVPVGFSETTEQYQALNIRSNPPSGNAFVKRANGEWNALPRIVSPASPVTARLIEGQDKAIYVASGTGTTYRVDKITYNPVTNSESVAQSWTGFNGPIYAMGVLPETGEILVTGNFTAPFNYTAILQGVGSTTAFYNLNGPGNAIYIDPAGYVWIGGDFTTPGTRLSVFSYAGVVIQNLIANASVRAIAAGPKTGQAYIGGDFFNVGPGATGATKLALIDILAAGAPSYSVVNGGVNGGNVYALAVGPDGTLYVGGSFTTDNNAGGPPFFPLLRVGKLVNNRLVPVGGGVGSTGQNLTSLAFDSAGNLYAAVANSYYFFEGIHWLPMEVVGLLTSLGQVLITSDNRQIVTYDTSAGFYYFAGITDIIVKGSAPSYPKIRIYGPTLAGNGTTLVHKVTNFTTGASIYLEYAMSYSEILTLDFTPRNIQITSNLFGSVKSKIVSSSQLAKFFLAPGRNENRVNRIVVLADNTPTLTTLSADITWRNTYLGIEGSVK
jgi:hypothetical protein